jgi:hypothetical protein
MEQSDEKARRIESEIGSTAFQRVREQIESSLEGVTPQITTASAWIDHYLLIDFGFTANVPYVPNSIQFYSPTDFLCYKTTDNASMATLVPILGCKYVQVTWDVSTLESVHIYGLQPKS